MPTAIYFGKENAHEEGQNRGCSGPAELAIVVSKRSWHDISEFLWKVGVGTKKEEQKERSAGERCGQQSVGSFTTANSLLQLPRTPFWPVRTFPSTALPAISDGRYHGA